MSRQTYEAGVPKLEGPPHFATYGDPVFEAVLAHLTSFALPACVRRLVVEEAEAGTVTVAYAVTSGSGTPRLVQRYGDLEALPWAETEMLPEGELQRLRKELEAGVKIRSDRRRGVQKIEELNERTGRSQLVLDYLAAYHLLRDRQKFGQDTDRFWQELASMERSYAKRNVLRISGIPLSIARRLETPLFEAVLPGVGEEGYVDAPRLLLTCAFDAAARVGDSLHKKKDELAVSALMGRLEREIRTLLQR